MHCKSSYIEYINTVQLLNEHVLLKLVLMWQQLFSFSSTKMYRGSGETLHVNGTARPN